jgi:hypothetical protein
VGVNGRVATRLGAVAAPQRLQPRLAGDDQACDQAPQVVEVVRAGDGLEALQRGAGVVFALLRGGPQGEGA